MKTLTRVRVDTVEDEQAWGDRSFLDDIDEDEQVAQWERRYLNFRDDTVEYEWAVLRDTRDPSFSAHLWHFPFIPQSFIKIHSQCDRDKESIVVKPAHTRGCSFSSLFSI